MSLILNIDTSLDDASVSLSRRGEIIDCITNNIQKNHAAFLHVAISKLLTTNHLQPGDLLGVATTIGPGSYTGLRVGLTAAKGFAYALNKPLISVGTLNAMAHAAIFQNSENKDSLFCPMIDARRMEVYTALYDADMKLVMSPVAHVLEDTSFTAELEFKKILFFGTGMQKWKNICTQKNAFFIDLQEISASVSSLAFHKFEQNEFSDISLTIPLYLKDFFNNK